MGSCFFAFQDFLKWNKMIVNLLTIIIIALTFHIATQPGELLAPYAKFINFNTYIPTMVKKLLICPYCLAFWVSLVYVIKKGEHIGYSFAVFIVVYVLIKIWSKYF